MSAGEQILNQLAEKAVKNTMDLLRECGDIELTVAEEKLVRVAVGCAIEVVVKDMRSQAEAPSDHFAE